MEIDDLAPVFRLGERLFTRNEYPVLYRTWDPFEVTYYFNSDPEFCLVAETEDEEVIGFALGTTVEKERSAWKYGYLAWLGVAAEYQSRSVGRKLVDEFEKLMSTDGARILLVDTEASNKNAIRFFERNGFSHPQNHVWLSKSLAKGQRNGARPIKPVTRVQRGKKPARAKDSVGTDRWWVALPNGKGL